MKHLLKKISFVALGLVLAGIVLTTCGWLAGGSLSFEYIPKERKFVTEADENFKYKEESLDAFSNMEMKLDAMNIVLREGENFTISYPDTDYDKIKIAVENDILIVKSSTKAKISFFSFDTQSIKDRTITVTVPKGTRLKMFNGKTDAGNITFENITSDRVSFDVDCGNITLLNTILGDMDMELDAGNCEVIDSSINHLSAELDAGNIELSLLGASEEYNMEFKVDLGDVRLNGNKVNNNYTQKGSTIDKRIKVEIDCGNMDLNFKMLGV